MTNHQCVINIDNKTEKVLTIESKGLFEYLDFICYDFKEEYWLTKIIFAIYDLSFNNDEKVL